MEFKKAPPQEKPVTAIPKVKTINKDDDTLDIIADDIDTIVQKLRVLHGKTNKLPTDLRKINDIIKEINELLRANAEIPAGTSTTHKAERKSAIHAARTFLNHIKN